MVPDIDYRFVITIRQFLDWLAWSFCLGGTIGVMVTMIVLWFTGVFNTERREG